MNRRTFTRLAAGVGAATLAHPAILRAQAAWPSRPVKVIVPFAAGGQNDLVARPWAEALGKAFGQQFVIENRGGAQGLIGAEAAFRSAPDGYTFLFSSNSTTVFQPLLRKTNYDSRQFLLVARMGDSIAGFVVHPKHGFKTLQEMIAYAKANPGKLTAGTAGPGTSIHLRFEMLRHRTGIDVLQVHYRGGSEAVMDLLSGVIDMTNEGSALQHVKAGKLTLLNINHFERFVEFPEVPTLTECGVRDADVPIWFALYAPPGTPGEIVERVHTKISEISRTKEMKGILQAVSAVPVVQGLSELQAHLQADFKSIGDLIKAASIKME